LLVGRGAVVGEDFGFPAKGALLVGRGAVVGDDFCFAAAGEAKDPWARTAPSRFVRSFWPEADSGAASATTQKTSISFDSRIDLSLNLLSFGSFVDAGLAYDAMLIDRVAGVAAIAGEIGLYLPAKSFAFAFRQWRHRRSVRCGVWV
jgi:hypothetical protein